MFNSIWTHITTALVVSFIAYIFIADSPKGRIDRVCKPVEWTETVFVSITALVYPKGQGTVSSWFKQGDYSCQYIFWRQFYEDDYKAALKEAQVESNEQ